MALEEFTTTFVLRFGQNPETHEWAVVIQSNENGTARANSFKKKSLKGAVNEAYIRMRKRELHNRRFPPEPPSRIIKPEQAGRKILMPNGR